MSVEEAWKKTRRHSKGENGTWVPLVGDVCLINLDDRMKALEQMPGAEAADRIDELCERVEELENAWACRNVLTGRVKELEKRGGMDDQLVNQIGISDSLNDRVIALEKRADQIARSSAMLRPITEERLAALERDVSSWQKQYNRDYAQTLSKRVQLFNRVEVLEKQHPTYGSDYDPSMSKQSGEATLMVRPSHWDRPEVQEPEQPDRDAQIQALTNEYMDKWHWQDFWWGQLEPHVQDEIKRDPRFPHTFAEDGTCRPEDWVEMKSEMRQKPFVVRHQEVIQAQYSHWEIIRWLARGEQKQEEASDDTHNG